MHLVKGTVLYSLLLVVVQLLSHVQLFATPWTTACQASLSFTPSPAFIICRLFDGDHSNQREVISHCSFDLHSFYKTKFFEAWYQASGTELLP